MTGFVQFKGMFFDSKKVLSAVDNAAKSVLSKFGAFVRTTAKQSIKKKKGYSRPGEPPHSKTGILKKFIFFGYDIAAESVVVGPALLSGGGMGKAPSALEYGGQSESTNSYYWKKTDKGFRRVKKSTRTINLQARPYMNPALEKNIPQLPEMWRNSIK